MHYPKITFSYPFKPFLYTAIRPRIGAEVPITAQSDDGLDWLLSHRYTDTPHAPAAWPVPTEAVIDAATTEWLQRYPVPQWTAGRKGWGQIVDGWVRDQGTNGLIDLICEIARMEANGNSPRALPWVRPAVESALAARDDGRAPAIAAQWLAWLANRHLVGGGGTPVLAAKAVCAAVWDAAGGNLDRYAGAPERAEWAAADTACAAEVIAQRDALVSMLESKYP